MRPYGYPCLAINYLPNSGTAGTWRFCKNVNALSFWCFAGLRNKNRITIYIYSMSAIDNILNGNLNFPVEVEECLLRYVATINGGYEYVLPEKSTLDGSIAT